MLTKLRTARNNMTRLSLKKYQQTTKIAAEDASPYQLISMLLHELIGCIAAAKGELENNNHAKKGALISKAITIIGVLEGALDHNQGGDISINLSSIYLFCSEKLFEANLNNDSALLDDLIHALLPIKNGWNNIPRDQQNTINVKRN